MSKKKATKKKTSKKVTGKVEMTRQGDVFAVRPDKVAEFEAAGWKKV